MEKKLIVLSLALFLAVTINTKTYAESTVVPLELTSQTVGQENVLPQENPQDVSSSEKSEDASEPSKDENADSTGNSETEDTDNLVKDENLPDEGNNTGNSEEVENPDGGDIIEGTVPDKPAEMPQDPAIQLPKNGLLQEDGLRYYIEGIAQTGWYEQDGKRYYFKEDTQTAVIGDLVLEETLYHFGADGVLISSEPVQKEQERAPQPPTGLYMDGTRLRYRDPDTGLDAVQRWVATQGQAYYFDAQGYAVTGKQAIDQVEFNFNEGYALVTGLYQDFQFGNGALRYIHGAEEGFRLHTGWLNYQNSFLYYFDPNSKLSVKGDHVIDGVGYHFNDGYEIQTGLYQESSNNASKEAPLRYIDPKTFELKRNAWYQHTNKNTYYFDENARSVSGDMKIGDVGYHFDENGYHLWTGLYMDNIYKTLRYINRETNEFKKNEWYLHNNQELYYFGADGAAVKGEVKIGDVGYWFQDSGAIVTGRLYRDWFADPKNGALRYIDPNTFAIHQGWLNYKGNLYYMDPRNGLSVFGELVPINGVGYNFGDSNSYALVTGQIYRDWVADKTNGALRYIDPKTFAIHQGWLNYGGNLYYMNPQNGLSVFGNLVPINGVGYNFGDNNSYALITGQLYRDWVADKINGALRYIDPGTFAIHSGWLTVGNEKYYMNPATGLSVRGDVLIDRKHYVFNDGFAYQRMYIKGFDISSHQGEINWNEIPQDYGYVIVRAMSWADSQNMRMDPFFVKNIYGAKNAGLMVGAYWYSYAFNGKEALQEVTFIKESDEWNALCNAGVVLDLPFYIDYEYDSKGWLDKNTTYESRTEAVRQGMIYAEKILGVRPGFYSSASHINNWFDGASLIREGYDCWVAHYKDVQTPGINTSGVPSADMWQYTSTGWIPGISRTVDLNYSFKDFYFHPIVGENVKVSIFDGKTGQVITSNITDIVKCIVANEVGNGLGLTSKAERAELYKAQAIAARSWLLYQIQNGNTLPYCHITDVTTLRYNAEIQSAVDEVKNLLVIYNGQVANAAYGSCAGPYTNSAENMGWGNHAYLTSVESKYDREYGQTINFGAYYPKTTIIGLDKMRDNIIKMVGQNAYTPYASNPDRWIQDIVKDAYGNIVRATVCGITITGGKFYENCAGANLNSWKYNGNGTWEFSSNGNGHGVGMSQVGAAGYIAKEGWNYKKILEHYFPNAKVQ